MVQSLNVGAGQIVHVDVVADAGSIRCRIIRAEDLQLRTKTRGRLEREWNQVRLRIMQFADLAAVISPGRVKITQAGKTKSVGAVVGLQRLLEEELRNTIGIHRLSRKIFV